MPQSSSTFGRRLLGFFVTEAETKSSKSSSTPPALQQPSAVDPAFIDHFADVLAKANLPGPDYFEFRETLRGLAGLGLPEDKKIQVAWASFKAMSGVTDSAVLRNAAAQYLTIIRQDRDAFMRTADVTLAQRTNALQAEEAQLKADIDAKTRQLADIQARLKDNANRLRQINTELTEESTKIQQNRTNFEAAYETVSSQIAADVEHIKTYL